MDQELMGGEEDVLYRLFWFGPATDGDLPSKSGAASLVDKGLATWFQGNGTCPKIYGDYNMCMLTSSGLDVAKAKYIK